MEINQVPGNVRNRAVHAEAVFFLQRLLRFVLHPLPNGCVGERFVVGLPRVDLRVAARSIQYILEAIMKISKFVLVSAALATSALLGVSAVSAADLPARTYTKAPVAVAPVYSWTGCYIGIEGGGVWGRSQHYAADPADIAAGVFGFPQTGGIDPSGGIVGGTLGCNYQFSNNFVVGIEGDGSWTNNSASANFIAPFKATDVATTNQGWIATYRGRIGYAWDRLLLYATGGGASTNIGVNLCDPVFGCISSSQTRSGWAAGAGIEYAFWQNFSVKLEYLHLDFGRTNFGQLVPSPGFTFLARNVSLNNDIVRVGLNYKFGWGGPVVAKY
jgi:outer membrane immunogenic protein